MAQLGTNLPKVGSINENIFYDTPTQSNRMGEVTETIFSNFGDDLPFTKIGALSNTLQNSQSNTVLNNKNNINDPYANAPLDNYLTSSYGKSGEPSISAKSMNDAMGKNIDDTDHKIKLVELIPGTNQETYTLFFEVMPEITEARNVSYEPVAPAQFPGAFQKYKNTDSTQWTVNATLIARTTDEATKNLEYLNRLRGWTMPYFGDVTGNQFPERLGAPPPVLIFSGFRQHMIGPVPVVVTSLNWQFPKDVDYIPAISPSSGNFIPFPTVIRLGIQLVESFSTTEFNNFNLTEFRMGNFDVAFSGNTSAVTSEPIVDSQAEQQAQSIAPSSMLPTATTAGTDGIDPPTAQTEEQIIPQPSPTLQQQYMLDKLEAQKITPIISGVVEVMPTRAPGGF